MVSTRFRAWLAGFPSRVGDWVSDSRCVDDLNDYQKVEEWRPDCVITLVMTNDMYQNEILAKIHDA